MTEDRDLWFVDSNVLLYRYDAVNPEKQVAAKRWLEALEDTRTARLSWQVLNEFYDNATRKLGMPHPLIRRAAVLYGAWGPLGFSLGLIERAWHWTDRAQLRYWDALIVASAESLSCRYLLSEDFQTGRRFGEIQVVSPFRADPEKLFGRSFRQSESSRSDAVPTQRPRKQ